MFKITRALFPEQFTIIYEYLRDSPFSLAEKNIIAEFIIRRNMISYGDGYVTSENILRFVEKMKLICTYTGTVSVTSLCNITFNLKIVKKLFMKRTFHKRYIKLSEKDLVTITFFLIKEKYLISETDRTEVENFISRYYFFKYNNMELPCVGICEKSKKK